jgi:hypothetical protein
MKEAFRNGTAALLSSVLILFAAPILPNSLASEVKSRAKTSTPMGATNPSLFTAKAAQDAKLIANILENANANGLKTATADPGFKKAVFDLAEYLAAAGPAGLTALKSTGDIDVAIIAAAAAGEFADLKGTWADFKTEPQNVVLEKLTEQVTDKLLKVDTPTPVWDAAKVGAKFMMAYENGFIDSVAPNGFRSLPAAVSPPPSQAPATMGAAPPPPPISAPPPSWKAPSATSLPSGSLSAISPSSLATPGGISLSKAAAARTPLNLDLDGAYYKDGEVVLSGRYDPEHRLDAALLLTAIRLACESDDPYFSLDPLEWCGVAERRTECEQGFLGADQR